MTKNDREKELEFFKETFILLNGNARKFDYRLKTHPFSPSEKKLLQAFSNFKKNNKEETLSSLKGFKCDNHFYEGVRLYLLGLTQNHYGAFAFAVEHLKSSVETFRSIEEEVFILYPLTSLVLALGNQRKTQEMAKYVDEMKCCKPRTDHSKLLMIHAEAVYLVISDEMSKADRLLKKALSSSLEGLDMFMPSFLVLMFSVAFKKKRYKECSEYLEKYKQVAGFTVKLNYLYMKCLLHYIVSKKPLYIYESDYKDFPEMHHQLEVIKALSLGDKQKASEFWCLLQKHNTSLYKDGFEYAGDFSLFSVALEMNSNHLKSSAIDLEKLNKLTSSTARLHFILTNSHAPISKADIIRLIWNEEYTEASKNRLHQLIFRYKKEYNQNVISLQDTYKLPKAG